MHGNDKKFIIMSMVVVGAGLVLGLTWAPRQAGQFGMPNIKFEKFVPPPVYFVEGAPLPEGFPADLILEKGAPISVAVVSPDGASTQNLSTSTRNMMRQQTVRWNSGMSVDALAAAYDSYFSKNGWTVDNKSESPDGKSLGMRAARDTASVTVSLSSRPQGTLVTVEYKIK